MASFNTIQSQKMLFDKYLVVFNDDPDCKGGGGCYCRLSVSVGLPEDTIFTYRMWHNNLEWRQCVTIFEWLEGMISPDDCGPPEIEDDFAGLQVSRDLLLCI